MPLTTGSRLGSYEILGLLGAGGMGEVYRARDTRLDRIVAIKVLPAHVADDPDLRQRFEREARAVAALNHPHICTLHDVGSQDGIDYLVMEYLEGQTIAERLHVRTGPGLRIEEALSIAVQIASALDAAHRQGITHRDLKPSNVMLTKSGAKVLDFGSALPTMSASLTAQGTILGTFQYMAPEQLEGKDADARTDIFAFGALVYEMGPAGRPSKARVRRASSRRSCRPIRRRYPPSSHSFLRPRSRRQKMPGERPGRALAKRSRPDEPAEVGCGSRLADRRAVAGRRASKRPAAQRPPRVVGGRSVLAGARGVGVRRRHSFPRGAADRAKRPLSDSAARSFGCLYVYALGRRALSGVRHQHGWARPSMGSRHGHA